MKKTYQVITKEVYYQPVTIEAESEEEAIELVEGGEGELNEDQFEYSCTLDSDEWDVYLIEANSENILHIKDNKAIKILPFKPKDSSELIDTYPGYSC